MNYVDIALNSRKLEYMPVCELCRSVRSMDIDHILWRWGKRNIDNRMYDPYNMIFLCRHCHTNKWWREWKQNAKHIARQSIESAL